MPEHQDTTLSPGTTYYYRVIALNSAGESVPSEVIEVRTPSGLPAAPANLTARAISSISIELSWDVSTGTTTYKLQRAASLTGAYSTISTTSETAHLDTGLASGTTYFYRVIASNISGDSGPSNVASATTFQVSGGNCPSSAIKVNPGDNIEQILSSAPLNADVCIAPGTYRGFFIRPRNGISIFVHLTAQEAHALYNVLAGIMRRGAARCLCLRFSALRRGLDGHSVLCSHGRFN
ncbi:MAG: fibronectin type III domain-containing protein [Actinobacteria bacterium]|nr:fibronectin type III domain-containing protein [Actinomycetota bacterium]